MTEEEIAKVRDYALKLLSFRPRSIREIEVKLKVYVTKKKLSPELLPGVIDWLKNENFLNDADFAKWWIAARHKSKPKGKFIITQELLRKGINKEIISENIKQTTTEEEIDLALNFIKKKFANKKFSSEIQKKVKISGLLLRRGFSYEITKAVIDLYTSKKLK